MAGAAIGDPSATVRCLQPPLSRLVGEVEPEPRTDVDRRVSRLLKYLKVQIPVDLERVFGQCGAQRHPRILYATHFAFAWPPNCTAGRIFGGRAYRFSCRQVWRASIISPASL